VTFKIPRAVLALTVRLIDRLRIDARTSRARPFVVCVNIVDMYDETRVRDIRGQGRIESVLRRDAVEPDGGVTGADLPMDRLAFRVSVRPPTVEAKRVDQEIVSRRDVLVRQNGNDSLEGRHEVSPFPPVRPTIRAEPRAAAT